MKIKGENLISLRHKNRAAVLRVLSSKSMTMLELAHEIKLSNTGTVTIVEEMVGEGILCKENMTFNSVGRHPYLIRINDRCGVVCLINFSYSKKFYLCSLSGKTLYTGTLHAEQNEYLHSMFTPRTFELLVKEVKEWLSANQMKLLKVCVAAPGIVDSKEGRLVYAPSFRLHGNMSIKAYFEEAFGVETCIKNDLKFALLAEKQSAALGPRIQDTLMIQLGEGIGSALFMKGELYEGSRGRGSEIGMFNLDCLHGSCFDEKENLFYRITSYHHICEEAAKEIRAGTPCCIADRVDSLRIEDVVFGYENGDPLCNKILDSCARITAAVIASLCYVIDFSNVIVLKRNFRFGLRYLRKVEEYANQSGMNISFFLSCCDGEEEFRASMFHYCAESVLWAVAKRN